MPRSLKRCARPKCTRLEASKRTGLCKHHARQAGMPVGYVDATAAMEHYRALRAAGVTTRELSILTGLDKETLQLLGLRKCGRCEGETERRVMAVPLPEGYTQSLAWVPSLGTRRRLQALTAIGYSNEHIAKEFGITPQAVSAWSRGDQVTSSTAARVVELFNRLQLTPGPSDRARRRAKRMGWAPPLAWDEDSIDDPDAIPSVGSPESTIASEPTIAMTDGEWRKVGGNYDDRFEVSRDGRVMSLAYETRYRTTKGKLATRRIPAKELAVIRTTGRPTVLLGTGRDTKNEVKLDRLVAGLFHGYPYEPSDQVEASGWKVRHKDGDIWHCHADNLEWVRSAGDHANQAAYEANLAAWEAAKQESLTDWANRMFGDAA